MHIPENLNKAMTAEFKRYPSIEKAALFGSRVRGDNTERSDYDIAVYGKLADSDKAHLHYVFSEDLPTLHKVDLVFYDDCSNAAFKKSIDTEGIIIYDKAR